MNRHRLSALPALTRSLSLSKRPLFDFRSAWRQSQGHYVTGRFAAFPGLTGTRMAFAKQSRLFHYVIASAAKQSPINLGLLRRLAPRNDISDPCNDIFEPRHDTICRARSGFTLVETLISLGLLAVLFVLLGGLLSGMARISRTAADVSVFDREIDFCSEIIRKELGEILLDNSRADFTMLGGNEFLAYTTTRDELLVRDSIPGGAKRVEWRYDPGAKKLIRTVTKLVTPGSELPPVSSSYFLEGLVGIQICYYDGVGWYQLSGVSTVIPQSKSLALRFIVNDDGTQKIYETAFWLPHSDAKLQKF